MLLISRVNEFPNTVNISPGSRIIFPNTKEYILNNHNEWVPIHMMAFEIKNDLVSEDLNSIENFGIYHQNNTSNAKLTKNYPSESAGVLKVYKSNDFVYQEYTVLSGQINENKTYVRSKYVGVWSNWVAPTYISDSDWNTIKNNSHSHSNKTLLDSLNNEQVNNWNNAYSWDNHATQGYIKISDTDTKYVPFIGDSKIKGSLIIQNKETYNNFLPGAFTLALNFNKVTLNNFGIYQNLDNEVNPNYWIGYKDNNNNIEKKIVEFNLNQNKFTLGKSTPIYIDTFQLSSINQVSYLTLDNSGKIGKIDGLPLSNFTETDPTVPSFVKAISNQQILNWNNITENYKNYIDDRIIEPNSISTNKLQFGFTSWDNNNSNPYADFLHFGGYQGATSGNQNLILFNKNNFGLRQYQKTSQSTEPYISFVDYWNTNNFKQVDINNWNEAHSWGNHAGLYASVAHSHTIANIKNLQTTLDGKVDLVSTQTITGIKNFQNGFDINSYQFRGLNSNVLTIGKNVFGNSLSKIVDSSIAVGNNVFPSMNLQPFDPVTESWNNKGFLGIGSDIFIDYTGDSNYRPDHNAHDSWIGLGRGLGAGFLDGTNVTLVGTGLLGKNDVKYADCVTIIGKGFTNGKKTRGTKTLDPNRVVPSKNGYNVHGMMSDVIGMGHENWIEDINQSVVVGSNLRPYSYVFNSLVLGHHHLNMNFEGTTEQADMYLDSDVIIGMGVGKRSSRHASSHNLLIGMDYFYSTGGAPNANYRPLIEGRFKDDAQFQVNGTIIGGFEKIDDDLPYLERVTFESVSLPSGVVYNASERSFTFDGTQASTSITLHNVPANQNRYVYIEISSSNHMAGSWGFSVYNTVDSGNGPTDNFVARQTFKTVSPTTFILTTEGNFKGTIHITCDYTDVTLRSINPNILLKDSKERKTFEIRTTQDPSIISMGLNSGKFLTHGGKTLILGNDILSETPAATNNVLVGNNIFKLGSDLGNNVVLGNAIGGDNTNLSHSVVIGNGNLQSNFTNNVARLTIVGHGAGKALTAGTHNNLFGEIAGVSLTKGSNNSFFGSASGLIKEGSNNTFIGHTAGGYGLIQSTVNNTIVIGANAAPEVPNNTTTIATAANTDNFLYGTTHSNAFKVRGGLATQVMMANGTLKDESTFGGSGSNNFLQSNPQLTYGADGLNYFNANNIGGNNPAINQAPTNGWHHIIRMNHGNTEGFYADLAISMTDNSGISRRVISNGAALSDWVKLWDSSNFNPDGKANALENATGIGLSSGQNPNTDNTYFPYFYSTYGFIALATRKWVADNYIPKSHPVYNITQANINSWNEAYTWGNHATAGYLKGIPTASTTVLGGIKIGYGLTINNQIVDVDAVKYKGNTPALTGNTKNVNGITLSGVYNNGYPTLYGNVLNLQGNGGGQLLAGWNGDTTTGALYYRSLRDNTDNWSDWREIAYTNWVSGNFMGKSGVQTVNNDFNIFNNGAGLKFIDNYTTLYFGNNELKISDDNILSFTGDAEFNGNILTKGIVASKGYSKRGLSDDYLLTANGGATHKQTFLNLDSNGHAINLNQDTDFNTITKTGFYRCDTGTNAPSGKSWYHIIIESHENGGGWCKQTATAYSTGSIESGITFTRVNVGGSWQPWKRLITDTDNAGINLLVASKNWSKNWVSNNVVVTIASIIYNGLAVSKATAAWAYFYQSYNFEVGKTYTLSAYVMCPNNNAINCGIYLFDNWSLDFGAVPSSWKRVSKTFTVTSAMVGSNTNRNVRIESGSSSDANPLYLAGMKLEESNFPSPWSMNPADIVDTYSPQTIDGNKKFGSTIIANNGIDVSDGATWGKFFRGNGDGATIATCNSDIGSWWGFGLGHTYTGNYTRTIAFDCRTGSATYTGSITANSFKKSGGTATQILMADGSVKEQSTIGGSNYTAGSNITIVGNAISVLNSPTFSGAVTAPAFYESSLRSLKTNIQPFEKSGLDLIKELDIVTFDRKDETAKNKIGIIADDSPKEFLSEELDAVDLYKTVFIQAKAIQELKSEVDELKELVKQLIK